MGILIMMLLIGVYCAILAVTVINYIFQSKALHRIGKKRCVSAPWRAWIPLACDWLIGDIADSIDGEKGIRMKWKKTIFILSLILMGLAVVYYVFAIIASIAFSMIAYIDEEYLIQFLLFFYVGLIPLFICSSALGIIEWICLYKIFEKFCPSKTVKYLIVSAIVPFGLTICLTKCTNVCDTGAGMYGNTESQNILV